MHNRRPATTLFVFSLLQICVVGNSSFAQDFAGRDKLRAHTQEFRKDVIKVTDGVYVAVGFSLGNAILIDGVDGRVIVDTTGSIQDAQAVKAEFDRISNKPVRAIIYTHFHGDHTGGAIVFAGADQPEVYAHKLLAEREPDLGRAGRDGGEQIARSLPDTLIINAGVGPQVRRPVGQTQGAERNRGYLSPTSLFLSERSSLEVAGVRLEVVHAPAETEDAVYVWLPDKRVLLPGDAFYRSFPNLYAIRGTRLRRADLYVAGLDKMLAERADYLVPSHTRPIIGAEAVRTALTAYRDGIKSVLEQTIEGMKAGLRPDELVEKVTLPPELAASPYLQEFYGTVAWSVRAIYTYYLGWFDGNATNLFPLSGKDRAGRILELAGGEGNVLAKARDALARREFQWAAELVDYVLANNPDHAEARRLKAQAFTELGERQVNATARNFYLSSAQYLVKETSVR